MSDVHSNLSQNNPVIQGQSIHSGEEAKVDNLVGLDEMSDTDKLRARVNDIPYEPGTKGMEAKPFMGDTTWCAAANKMESVRRQQLEPCEYLTIKLTGDMEHRVPCALSSTILQGNPRKQDLPEEALAVIHAMIVENPGIFTTNPNFKAIW